MEAAGDGVAPRDSGAAAGLLTTGLQVGAALGLSALASVASVVTRNHRTGRTVAAALTDGYASGLMVAAGFFAVVLYALTCMLLFEPPIRATMRPFIVT